MKIIVSFLFLIITTASCQINQKNATPFGEKPNFFGAVSDKIDGLNFVAPPSEFASDPMLEVKSVNADWIAVVPFGYTRVGSPTVMFSSRQWWGERPEGARKTVQLAHAAGLKVMMKPQVYVPGSWPGGLDFDSDADWAQWESDYRKYLMIFVKIAEEENAEMLCIGTEFRISVQKRPDFWRKLIKDIRTIYSGKLTYASNWDDYAQVPFWGELDYIGVDAYFPLVDAKTPEISKLKTAWKPIVNKMKAISEKEKKQILFTEYGYLSVDNCAWQTWELEKNIGECQVNQKAQANALHALFDTFWKEDFWAGGFLWKWFPAGEGHEGYKPKDYTPQGKLGAKILTEWYKE